MTILHISDTHNNHRQLHDLPKADVIVHSGDFTFAGTEDESMDFVEWFSELPYAHKVFIAGNHDYCLYGADINGLPDNVHYLYGNGVTINGLRFFGIPMFMEDNISGDYDKMLRNIPSDTDVLITHQPPHGVLDKSGHLHFGNKILCDMVNQTKPKTHLFGHIHVTSGLYQKNDVIYSNAALVGEEYELCHSPHLIEL